MARKSPKSNQGSKPILNSAKTIFCVLFVMAVFVAAIPQDQERQKVALKKAEKEAALEELKVSNINTKKKIKALSSPEYLENLLLVHKGLKPINREVYLYQHKR